MGQMGHHFWMCHVSHRSLPVTHDDEITVQELAIYYIQTYSKKLSFLYDFPLFCLLCPYLTLRNCTHLISPVSCIIAGGFILIYDFFALRTKRVVKSYHHAMSPLYSPMRRMKWCNGHGTCWSVDPWVMGQLSDGNGWVMGHERWPISISARRSCGIENY